MRAQVELRFHIAFDVADLDGHVNSDHSESEKDIRSSAVSPRCAFFKVAPSLALNARAEPRGDLVFRLREPVAVVAHSSPINLGPRVQLVHVRIEGEREERIVGLEGEAGVGFHREPVHRLELGAKKRNGREFADEIARRNEPVLEARLVANVVASVNGQLHARRMKGVLGASR